MEQVLEYIKRAHQGDKAARDLLVQNNLGLVWSIVRRFSNRGYDPEDLFQVGSIGLLKAIDRFAVTKSQRPGAIGAGPLLRITN